MMSSSRPQRDRKSTTNGVFRIFARSMQDICKNQPNRRKLPTPNQVSPVNQGQVSPVNQGPSHSQGTPVNHGARVIQSAPAFVLKIHGKKLNSHERHSVEGGGKYVSEVVTQSADEVHVDNKDCEVEKPCLDYTCTDILELDLAMKQDFDQGLNDSMKVPCETVLNENLVTTEILITEGSDSSHDKKLSRDGCDLKSAVNNLSEDWETSLCSVDVQENPVTELDHQHVADSIINCSTVIEEESDSEYLECEQTFCIEREQCEKQTTDSVDNGKEDNHCQWNTKIDTKNTERPARNADTIEENKCHNDECSSDTVQRELDKHCLQETELSIGIACDVSSNVSNHIEDKSKSQSSEVSNTGVNSSEVSNTGVPSSEVSNTVVPSSEVSNTGGPSSEVCNTGLQRSEVCNTGVQSTKVCNTGIPSSEVFDTGVQNSEVSNTVVPSSEDSNSCVPSSVFSDTDFPISEVCNTGVPRSEVSNTGVPSAEDSNTGVPSSVFSNTDVPSSEVSNTGVLSSVFSDTGVPSSVFSKAGVPSSEDSYTGVPRSVFSNTDVPSSEVSNTGVLSSVFSDTGVPSSVFSKAGVPSSEDSNTGVPSSVFSNTCVPSSEVSNSCVPSSVFSKAGVPSSVFSKAGVPSSEVSNTCVPSSVFSNTGVPSSVFSNTGVSSSEVSNTGVPSSEVSNTDVPSSEDSNTGVPSSVFSNTGVSSSEVSNTGVPSSEVSNTDVPSSEDSNTGVPSSVFSNTCVPSSEVSNTCVPSSVFSKAGVPSSVFSKAGVPSSEVSNTCVPSSVFSNTGVPSSVFSNTGVSSSEVSNTGVPSSEVLNTDVPSSEDSNTGVPSSVFSNTGAQSSEVSTTSVPSSVFSNTGVPSSEVSNTGVPSSEVSNTCVLSSVISNTGVPSSVFSNAGVPNSEVCSTGVPSSEVCNTGVPRSVFCNTDVPSSEVCDSSIPISEICKSCIPRSEVFNTVVPSSEVCNTSDPISEVCNTSVPSSEICNSSMPNSEVCYSSIKSSEVCNSCIRKSEVFNAAVPSPEVCYTGVPSSEVCNTGVPNIEVLNTCTPKSEVCNSAVPSLDFCNIVVPSSEVCSTAIPSLEVCNTGVPSSGICNLPIPSSEVCNTGVPSSEVCDTGAPSSEVCSTCIPSLEVCNTIVRGSEVCNLVIPSPEVCNTVVPSSEVCNTDVPSSEVCNLAIPRPEVCNTGVPSSEVCNTCVSSSEDRNTGIPSLEVYNTNVPSSEVCNLAILSSEVCNTGVPSSEDRNTRIPSLEVCSTNLHSSEVSNTNILSSWVCNTGVPSPGVCNTGHGVPGSEVYNTGVPSSGVCNTGHGTPGSEVYNTDVPSSGVCNTGHGIPGSEACNTGIPSSEVCNTGIPSSEVNNTGVPSSEVCNTGIPSSGVCNTGVPSSEVCNNGIPSSEVCNNGIPSSEVSNTNILSSEVCNTGIPSSEVCNTGVPSSEVCNNGIPSSGVCNTGVPSSGACNTGVPSSEACNTGIPSSGVCNTSVPSSEVCNKGIPSSWACNTGVPSSEVSNTTILSSEVCNNGVPSSGVCSTGVPSSGVCNTGVPSSEVCNTAEQKNINADIGKSNSGTSRHDIDSECVDALILQEYSQTNKQICCDHLPRKQKCDTELNKMILPPDEEYEEMCSVNRDTAKTSSPNSELQNVATYLHTEHFPSETDYTCQTGSDSACNVSAKTQSPLHPSNESNSSHSCEKPGKSSENEIIQTNSSRGHNVDCSAIGEKQSCESKNMYPLQRIQNHECCATQKNICDNTSVKNKTDTFRHKVKKRDKDRHVQGEKKERSTRKHEDPGYRRSSSTKHEKSVYESLIKEKMKAINREIKSKAVGLDSMSIYEPTVSTDDLSKLEKQSPYKQYITARTSKEKNGEEERPYVKTDRTDLQRNINKDVIRQYVRSVQADRTDPKVFGNMNRSGVGRQSVRSIQGDKNDPQVLGNTNRGIARQCDRSVQVDKTDSKVLGNINRGEVRQFVRSWQVSSGDVQDHRKNRPSHIEDWEQELLTVNSSLTAADNSTKHVISDTQESGKCQEKNKIQSDGNVISQQNCSASVEILTTKHNSETQQSRQLQEQLSFLSNAGSNGKSNNEHMKSHCCAVTERRNDKRNYTHVTKTAQIMNHQPVQKVLHTSTENCEQQKLNTKNPYRKERSNLNSRERSLTEMKSLMHGHSEDWESSLLDIEDIERQNFKREFTDQVVPTYEMCKPTEILEDSVHSKNTSTCVLHSTSLIVKKTSMGEFDWESSLLDVSDFGNAVNVVEKEQEVIETKDIEGDDARLNTEPGESKDVTVCRDSITKQYLPPPPPPEELEICDVKKFLDNEAVVKREDFSSKSVSTVFMNNDTSVPEVEIPEDTAYDIIPSPSPLSKEEIVEKLAVQKNRLKKNILEHESESEESCLPFSENTLSGMPTISDFDESVSDGNEDICVVHSQESSVEEAIQKQACEHTDRFSDQTESKNDLNKNSDNDESYDLSDQENSRSYNVQEKSKQYFHHSPYKHIGEKFGWRTRNDEYFNYVNSTTGVYKCTCPLEFVRFWIWRSCACSCGEFPLLCDIRNGMDFGMCYSHPGMSKDYKDKKVQFRPRGILGIAFPPPPPGEIWDKMQHGSEFTKHARTVGDTQKQNTPMMPGSYPTMQTTTGSYNCGPAPPGFSPLPSFSYPPPCNLLSPPHECFMRYRSPYSFHSPPPPENEGREPKCEGSQTRKVLMTPGDGSNDQILQSLEVERETEEKIKMPLKKRPILLDQFPDQYQTDPLVQNRRIVQNEDIMSSETEKYSSNISAQHSSVKMLNPLGKLFQGIRFPTLSPTREFSSNSAANSVVKDEMVSKMTKKLYADHSNMEKLQLHSPKLVDYNLSETDESEEENVKFKFKAEEASTLPCDNSLDGSESSGDKRKLELEEGELVEDEEEDYVTNKRRLVEASSSPQLNKENIDKVPRYIPPHKRLSWPQDKEKNISFTGIPYQDVNKRIVFYGDRRRSLESNTKKSEELEANSRTNVYSNSNPYLCGPSGQFWSSNYASTSPLLGYDQPTCLYPAGYFIDDIKQKSSPSAHSYGESHRAATDSRLQRSRMSSEIFSRWQIKSEDSPRRTSWQIKEGSPVEDVLVPQRLRFLQKSKLLDSDSDSGASVLLSDWKIRFKNKCQTYQGTFIDSHCHIDFLFNRQGFRGSWSKYRKVNEETFPDNYEGCVAVFCYPGSFRSEGLWKDVAVEDGVWLAFGCHPKHATEFTPKTEEGLRFCLQNEKVVALGEIGLDYSGIFMQHEAVQKIVFMKQIQIALELNKPLVIHCRQAEEDCLDILERMVPRNYRIHCHCFTGNYDSAKKWMDLFPNLYIGLTPLVTFKTAEPTHEVARFIPLERLLLETDAPYFIPRKIPKDEMQFSHPGMAVTVAESVAWFKRCSVGEVLTACRQNTHNMYGI